MPIEYKYFKTERNHVRKVANNALLYVLKFHISIFFQICTVKNFLRQNMVCSRWQEKDSVQKPPTAARAITGYPATKKECVKGTQRGAEQSQSAKSKAQVSWIIVIDIDIKDFETRRSG